MNRKYAAMVALGFGALVCAATAQAHAQAKKAAEGSIFFSGEIVNPVSNKCLDVTDESVRDGAAIQQWSCARQANQLWNVIDQGRGEYSIVSRHSKKALDIAGVSGEDGATIVQNDFQNVDNQRWRLEPSNTGTYQIINARTRKCLDLDGGKKDDGIKLQQWSCSSQPNQMWLLRK